MAEKCGSSCALFTINSIAPVRHFSFLPMPLSMKLSESLSNLVNDNLLRINRDFFNTISSESSLVVLLSSSVVLDALLVLENTLAFQRVSSLTSNGLQSSSEGAVSLFPSCFPFEFPPPFLLPPLPPGEGGVLLTPPSPLVPLPPPVLFTIASISCTRVSVVHFQCSAKLLLLASSSAPSLFVVVVELLFHDDGGSKHKRRNANNASAVIRIIFLSPSSPG